MRLALIGFGSVGRSFCRLLQRQRSVYPFRVVGIHTANHGTAYSDRGLDLEPNFGPAAGCLAEFLEKAHPEIVVELTALDPFSGQPAIDYILQAFERGAHVVTANKGPVAHAYSTIVAAARKAGVEFRFESTCMDGAPVFNMVRDHLPGVRIMGFTGVLNSTSQIAVDAMRSGLSLQQGLAKARTMGLAEADPSFDIDGWDSSVKTAALANVLMDAKVTPADVERTSMREITPEYVQALARDRKQIRLVSRAGFENGSLRLKTRPEELDDTDLLAAVHGASNLLLLHTDLMGTLGAVTLSPTVEQTAYGVFSDVVDIAKSL